MLGVDHRVQELNRPISRQRTRLADFALLAGAQYYLRLRAKCLVPKLRLPSSVGSTGLQFMRLCGAMDTTSMMRKI